MVTSGIAGTESTTIMSTQKIVKKTREMLTLNHNILTDLLVALTSAADPLRETITLVLESLTLLRHQDMHHQLILNTKDQ